MTRAACLLAACALIAGCGGGGGAGTADVLRETADKLADLHSGTLHLDVRIDGRGGGQAARLGFAIDGPFALASKGRLPVGELRYVQRSGDAQQDATLISTGDRAWVRTGGRTTELTPGQQSALRQAAGDLGTPSALKGLRIERWVRDAKQSESGDVTRIRARLDVPATMDDLARLLGRRKLDDGSRKQLEKAVRTSAITIETGREDRLLRRLDAELELGFAVAPSLKRALGSLVGGKLTVRMRIERPNQPVGPPRPPVTAQG